MTFRIQMDGVMTFCIPILGVITFRIEMFIVMTFGIPILEAMTFRIEMFGVIDIQYSTFRSDDFGIKCQE